MKCPKCGFISFDDLIQCKKCGAQLKETKTPDNLISNDRTATPREPEAEGESFLPPQWRETIKTIKRELEAIEGSAVDRQSHVNPGAGAVAELDKHFSATTVPAVPGPCLPAAKGGFLLRLLAYTIDCTIVYCFTLALLLAGFIFLRSSALDMGKTDTLDLLRLLFIPYIIASTVIESFYFTYCHAVTGQTIGKWICGLKVVNERGELIGYKRAFIRWLGYLVSRFFLYAGFIWVAFSREKRGWHDKIAGSYVIRV